MDLNHFSTMRVLTLNEVSTPGYIMPDGRPDCSDPGFMQAMQNVVFWINAILSGDDLKSRVRSAIEENPTNRAFGESFLANHDVTGQINFDTEGMVVPFANHLFYMKHTALGQIHDIASLVSELVVALVRGSFRTVFSGAHSDISVFTSHLATHPRAVRFPNVRKPAKKGQQWLGHINFERGLIFAVNQYLHNSDVSRSEVCALGHEAVLASRNSVFSCDYEPVLSERDCVKQAVKANCLHEIQLAEFLVDIEREKVVGRFGIQDLLDQFPYESDEVQGCIDLLNRILVKLGFDVEHRHYNKKSLHAAAGVFLRKIHDLCRRNFDLPKGRAILDHNPNNLLYSPKQGNIAIIDLVIGTNI